MIEEVQYDLNLFEYVIHRLESEYWKKNWGVELGPRIMKDLKTIIEQERQLGR